MPNVHYAGMCYNLGIVGWDAPNAEILRGESCLLIMGKIELTRVSNLKVNIVKKTDNELKIEVEGAGHSLLNVLQKTLLEDDTIEMVGYHIPHPLFDSGILYVHTKEKRKPEVVIKEATKKILDLNKEFQKSFKKASKDWKQK